MMLISEHLLVLSVVHWVRYRLMMLCQELSQAQCSGREQVHITVYFVIFTYNYFRRKLLAQKKIRYRSNKLDIRFLQIQSFIPIILPYSFPTTRRGRSCIRPWPMFRSPPTSISARPRKDSNPSHTKLLARSATPEFGWSRTCEREILSVQTPNEIKLEMQTRKKENPVIPSAPDR